MGLRTLSGPRLAAVVVLLLASGGVSGASAAPPPPPGPAAPGPCVSLASIAGCAEGRAFDNPTAGGVLSADGRAMVLPAATAGTLAVLTLDPATGSVTQPPGPGGCVAAAVVPDPADARVAETCSRAPALMDAVVSAAVSPDGRFVYAISRAPGPFTSRTAVSLAVLERLPDGGLVQRGCVANEAVADCAVVASLDWRGIAISPDGAQLYAAGAPLTIFARDAATGALAAAGTLPPPPARRFSAPVFAPDGLHAWMRASGDGGAVDALVTVARDPASGLLGFGGCHAARAVPGCRRDRRLGASLAGIAPTADGRWLYVSAAEAGYDVPPGTDTFFSIAAFRVDAATGSLRPGPCISTLRARGCTRERRLGSVGGTLGITGDGRRVLVAAVGDAVALRRDVRTGRLTVLGATGACAWPRQPCRRSDRVRLEVTVLVAPRGRRGWVVSSDVARTGTVAAVALR